MSSGEKSEKLAFGRKLRAWRMDAGLDRAQLARRLGVSEKTIQNVELGQQNLGRAARVALGRLMKGHSPADECAEAQAHYGSEPNGAKAAEGIARFIEDGSLQGQATKMAEVLGLSYHDALVHVIEIRLKHGG